MVNFILLGVIGWPQILLIALVVLLLFGGKKIPELMRGIGKGMGEFKKGIKEGEESLKDSDKKNDPSPNKEDKEN